MARRGADIIGKEYHPINRNLFFYYGGLAAPLPPPITIISQRECFMYPENDIAAVSHEIEIPRGASHATDIPRRTKQEPRRQTREATVPVKRGARRNRKQSANTPERANASPQAPVKRGRGRPRKTETAGIASVNRQVSTRPRSHDVTTWMDDIRRHGLAFVRALLGHEQVAAVNLTQDDIMTPKEVADLVRLRESEVVHAIESGDLKATRIGNKYRITRENVGAWLS